MSHLLSTVVNSPAVKLIALFLFSYPFAGLLKRVPDSKPAYKNLFIIRFVPVCSDDWFSDMIHQCFFILSCGTV
jgi:hypothetical protein